MTLLRRSLLTLTNTHVRAQAQRDLIQKHTHTNIRTYKQSYTQHTRIHTQTHQHAHTRTHSTTHLDETEQVWPSLEPCAHLPSTLLVRAVRSLLPPYLPPKTVIIVINNSWWSSSKPRTHAQSSENVNVCQL